jgi:hypothetical protein
MAFASVAARALTTLAEEDVAANISHLGQIQIRPMYCL